MFSIERTVNGIKYKITQNQKGEVEIAEVKKRFSPDEFYNGLFEDEEELLRKKPEEPEDEDFPQAAEPNEYRYIDPAWIDAVAAGLTAGAKKHPKETWKKIPAKEHAARAIRHLFLFCKGDQSDDHLINASMRCMMASVMARAEAAED